MVSAVNIDGEGRKSIFKGICDKALGRKVVTLVRLNPRNDAENTRERFKRCCVQVNAGQNRLETAKTVRGIFKRYTPNDAVNFIALVKKELGEVGTILTTDPGNQRLFHDFVFLQVIAGMLRLVRKGKA